MIYNSFFLNTEPIEHKYIYILVFTQTPDRRGSQNRGMSRSRNQPRWRRLPRVPIHTEMVAAPSTSIHPARNKPRWNEGGSRTDGVGHSEDFISASTENLTARLPGPAYHSWNFDPKFPWYWAHYYLCLLSQFQAHEMVTGQSSLLWTCQHCSSVHSPACGQRCTQVITKTLNFLKPCRKLNWREWVQLYILVSALYTSFKYL
jgi:hypothetical protein